MQRIELKPKAPIVLVIGECEYQIKRPTIGAAIEMEESLEAAKADGKGGTRLVRDYLVKFGLPSTIADSLDTEDVTSIMGALIDSKKNQ